MERHEQRPTQPATPAPGDALLHPAALIALALLVLNDHVLKAAFPGTLTGKLSDVAGLVFFPILVMAACELAGRLWGRPAPAPPQVTVLVIALTGIAFVLVKTQPAAADAFGLALGAAQWLIALPAHLALGEPVPAALGARVIADPTDLLALPALAMAWWVAGTATGGEPRPRRILTLGAKTAGPR